ncbi:MAG TPA: mechanosensitive ion channel domain-containing protein, partial [Acidimicrobiales bacterium]|nr:mechanosensitive ion channel domain-containing protein [Acidimicrobiales bacterium]
MAATSPPPLDSGWIYDLLRWAGVDPATAHHVQSALQRPLTIVLIVLLALVALWLGNRAIKHWFGAAARKAAGRAESPRAVTRASTITALLSSIWRVVVLTVAFFIVLGTLGINLTPLLASATVIGATIGFGAQTVVRDVLAGFLLMMEGQYDIGDTLVVGDTVGTVEDLSLRVTRLRGTDGSVWFVPNGEIRKLSNRTRGWAQVFVDMAVPAVADVDTVLAAARAGAAEVAEDPAFAHDVLRAPEVLGIVGADAEILT